MKIRRAPRISLRDAPRASRNDLPVAVEIAWSRGRPALLALAVTEVGRKGRRCTALVRDAPSTMGAVKIATCISSEDSLFRAGARGNRSSMKRHWLQAGMAVMAQLRESFA